MKFFQGGDILIFGIIVLVSGIVKADVVEQFQENGVVPDVLDKAPPKLLKVSYNGIIFEPGDKLTPTEVKTQPEIDWNFDKDKFYAMIMTDPDAPSRQDPSWGEFLHWSVVNIPGDDFSKGETLAEFMPSGPPKNTDYHRYTFVVYEQPEKINFEETPIVGMMTVDGRPKYSLKKFAEKYNFGDPVAGNLFLAEFDDFVTEFMDQAGIVI